MNIKKSSFCCAVSCTFLSLLACKSEQEIIKTKTTKIIIAIRDSDFYSFENMINKDRRNNSSEEYDLFYFNTAHDYMTRFFKREQSIPFSDIKKATLNLQMARDINFYMNEVDVPVFTGFDSSTGLKKAVLKLYFGDGGIRFSRHTKFEYFDLHQDLDVRYREIHIKF